ncbi:hypothetical protein [Fibrella forsythiae]|uniref:Uncharacterized protein n=1 Tax=Fibrella forsythiae TaxID=2817061 RepID=A0ABS3JPA6_9BACT|nr:hypothetical protein [Fibrella forsythiae]MBO0951241.1 hypothetical protein [Fibrella forsythiae]
MGTFNFALDSYKAIRVRSLRKDTNTVGFTVSVVGKGAPITQTKFMGDHGNGSKQVNFFFGSIEVADTDVVRIAYNITNRGGSRSETAALIEDGLHKLVSTGTSGVLGEIPIIGGALKEVADWVVENTWGKIHANCDGPVAVASYSFTGAELRSKIGTHTDHHDGIDSAAGCGKNSIYEVTWRIS